MLVRTENAVRVQVGAMEVIVMFESAAMCSAGVGARFGFELAADKSTYNKHFFIINIFYCLRIHTWCGHI